MERLEGLDEEFQKEETEKVTSIEEAKKKRPPFHYWEVAGVQHKMKLNTGMITKLENKYRTNIMTLVTANDIPPLGVMLTIAQAAIEPWEHGTTFDKVTKLYDKWLEEGGNQFDFMAKVIMPTMAVSGFFTPAMAESLMKDLDQADVILKQKQSPKKSGNYTKMHWMQESRCRTSGLCLSRKSTTAFGVMDGVQRLRSCSSSYRRKASQSISAGI